MPTSRPQLRGGAGPVDRRGHLTDRIARLVEHRHRFDPIANIPLPSLSRIQQEALLASPARKNTSVASATMRTHSTSCERTGTSSAARCPAARTSAGCGRVLSRRRPRGRVLVGVLGELCSPGRGGTRSRRSPIPTAPVGHPGSRRVAPTAPALRWPATAVGELDRPLVDRFERGPGRSGWNIPGRAFCIHKPMPLPFRLRR
jgi:hypothetical protein